MKAQNYSSSASEINSPEVRGGSPQSAASDDDDESENDEVHHPPKRASHTLLDITTLEALLKEIAVESHPADDLSQLRRPLSGSTTPLYEVRSSPGKGLGVFAAADIPRGTRIFADPPLFYVIGPKAMISEIEAGFQNFSSREQKEYLSLRCPDYPGKSPIIRRW